MDTSLFIIKHQDVNPDNCSSLLLLGEADVKNSERLSFCDLLSLLFARLILLLDTFGLLIAGDKCK
ncbi:hypothetical protein [Endozoicomonas sp. Mp262]|uniref:hypothetical protein n=1 Tax=Endozoicomonas sp. Mp262 TaxID=2919499 RepID=UPI0021D9527F